MEVGQSAVARPPVEAGLFVEKRRKHESAPGIIDYHCRAELGRLHDSLNFAAIPHPLSGALCEKKIDGTPLVPVAALKKGIGIKERAKAVLGPATFEEILSNGFWNQDS